MESENADRYGSPHCRGSQAILDNEGTPGTIAPGRRKVFALGGDAVITVVGVTARFTYHIEKNTKGSSRATHWVSVLRGSDNENNFSFMGGITADGFYVSDRGQVRLDAPSAKAFGWFWRHPEDARMQVLHAGLCARCGRLLTTPESIRSGFGPVCEKLNAAGK